MPCVDTEQYPRQNVHRPTPGDNPGNAWAWKVRIDGDKDDGALLSNVTFALKDNVAVKDVPMLVGTDVFTGYVPDTDATVVRRVLKAGGTIEGKAVCENLSLCASSFSASDGKCRESIRRGLHGRWLFERLRSLGRRREGRCRHRRRSGRLDPVSSQLPWHCGHETNLGTCAMDGYHDP